MWRQRIRYCHNRLWNRIVFYTIGFNSFILQ